MSGFVDPVSHGLYISDNKNSLETRGRFASFEYLIYQADDLAALNIKNAFVAAIENQYASARALVAQVMPGRGQRRPVRPRSKDEGDPYGR